MKRTTLEDMLMSMALKADRDKDDKVRLECLRLIGTFCIDEDYEAQRKISESS